ncbi:hypothetical protein [Lichenifustis flavocetrariae]|uniref:VPLPA-CTERM sorting domain-containing protein n=1 Tax=Lichenifustis flavocetrariae TaxID=2949735 RepID=A0AA41YXI6_9HYPH|nr:hypothetical protein [Lichenifustis flavocetrariae]MCW6508833.1 hypothetical protein [Lichenifustis flavocetrariae]
MLKLAVVSIFLSAAAFATEADATTIVNVKYSGKIDAGNGFDQGNDFTTGAITPVTGTSLAGSDVTVSYLFNTPDTTASSSGFVNYSGGGIFAPPQSPAVSATVTINGKSVSFSGADYGVITESRDAVLGSGFQDHEAGQAGSDYANSTLTIADGAPLDSVFGNFTYKSSSADTGFTHFELADGTFGNFVPSSISQTVSTVPLPSGLPMFGAALIGLGFAAFARRGARNA